MLMHEIGCPSLTGGECSCTPINIEPDQGFHDFKKPDQKARRIDPAEAFQIEITYTSEMQERLRRAADPKCVICFGRGLHEVPGTGWQMCSCLDI